MSKGNGLRKAYTFGMTLYLMHFVKMQLGTAFVSILNEIFLLVLLFLIMNQF